VCEARRFGYWLVDAVRVSRQMVAHE
jgi:hypothetical protein